MSNLIGISGRISSGKDTVGMIIQALTSGGRYADEVEEYLERYEGNPNNKGSYRVVKFADKLKDIICLLIGCSREDLENQEFKEKPLGEEWWKVRHTRTGEVIDYQEFLDRKYVHAGKWKITKMNPRLFMQLLGTEAGREILHPQVWVNATFSDYRPEESWLNVQLTEKPELVYPNWIITDVRYGNECKTIKDRGGILIRVNRHNPDGSIYGWGNPNADHPSETSLDDYQDWDYIIDNDSDIPDLINKVKEILRKENIL